MRTFICLCFCLPMALWASPETLVGAEDGRWGFVVSPEVRLTEASLGYRLKVAGLYTTADHGFELGAAVLSTQQQRAASRQDTLFYGLSLGYRFLPHRVTHLDTELTVGLANIEWNGEEGEAYALDLATAWKINVSRFMQVGLGVGLLLSAQPDNDNLEPLQDIQLRILLDLGRF